MNELNKNQKAFCQEYMKNGMNGTKAYMKVYKTKDEDKAGASASRLLGNVKIQEYIKSLQEKLEDKAIVTAEEIIKELKAIAFVDRTNISKIQNNLLLEKDNGIKYYEPQVIFNDTDNLTEEQRKVISGYKKTQSGFAIETYDKVKALEMLGKYIGMFNDKQDITINNNVENPYKNLTEEELKKLAGE
jgi:phage terminase small subunit